MRSDEWLSPQPMTANEARRCLRTLGWSQRQLATHAGCDDRLVRHWCNGRKAQRYPIPPAIAAWLRELAAAHAAVPAPRRWQQRPGMAAPPQDTPVAPFPDRLIGHPLEDNQT
jgi:hypothetical protein